MTRGPEMAETRWSNYTGVTPPDTNDVELIPSAPSISSYRPMYHHATPPTANNNKSLTGMSPNHAIITPNPSMMPTSTVFDASDPYGYSFADWSPRHCAIDVARVQIKPDASVSSSDPDIYKRSVNERLDKYMVIRQRTFHGLIRSKSDRRQLPLTDPRETMSEGSTPTWLHRSKTDLYIEKWRSKSNGKNRERSKSSSSAIDLSGMTLGSLCESLPKRRLQKAMPSSTARRNNDVAPKSLVPNQVSNGSETRFPPLPTSSIKPNLAEPNGKITGRARDRLFEPDMSVAKVPSTLTEAFMKTNTKKQPQPDVLVHLPSQRQHENDQLDPNEKLKNDVKRTSEDDGNLQRSGNGEKREGGKLGGGGVSQGQTDETHDPQSSSDSTRKSKEKSPKLKKNLAPLPLQVWEPSLENIAPSNQNCSSPRHQTRAWPSGTLRQGNLK